MRSLRLAAMLCMAPLAAAAAQRLTAADSALVARLLLAEDRRDTTRAAYADGLTHADARIRTIAQRGLARSLDPVYSRRDSLAPLPAPPHYDEPAWRLRVRALGNKNDDCAALGKAGHGRQSEAFTADIMDCESYNEAVQRVMKWVTVR